MRVSNKAIIGWIILISSVVFIISTMPVIVAICGVAIGWWLVKRG